MRIKPSVFPLIFPSHLRNTLKILCFYNCSVCLPKVSQRLPEIWKLPASCWANWTLNGESEARCDSTHPARRSQYWSLHWLCWMLIVWEKTSMLDIPNVGQATLQRRATIYLLPSLLPSCFQGPCPVPGVKSTFWPQWRFQSAASMAESSQLLTACLPAPRRREGRGPQKEWQQKGDIQCVQGAWRGQQRWFPSSSSQGWYLSKYHWWADTNLKFFLAVQCFRVLVSCKC